MPNYAGIGSRRLSSSELQLCKDIGSFLAKKGWTLHTGAAKGADQAFAEGALEQNSSVILYLPWATYEQGWVAWAKSRGAQVVILKDQDREAHHSVDLFHPAAEKLTRGPRALHARNYLIIKDCSLIIVYPKVNEFGNKGGTEQGLRIAKHFGIKVRDLSEKWDYEAVVSKLYQNIPKDIEPKW